MRLALFLLAVPLAACGGDDTDDGPIDPTENAAREIVDTQLSFDVSTMTATAKIQFAPSKTPGASLEIGDLTIDTASVPFTDTGKQLDLGLPASDKALAVDIAYHYAAHEDFDGASAKGFTLVWPYFCGNLFPCHSQPSDGTTFTLDVTGATGTAVFPTSIPAEAPPYQVAWAIGSYAEIPLGATTAGTQLSVWHLPTQASKAMQGTANLVAAFDWFETHIGPYRFGPKAGGVAVAWGPGAFGGMEHHPFWHVGSAAIGDQETHVHEAAHGWFGDGIRIKCWEDFVLSEGTVTYLAGRALDVVAPAVGTTVWDSYTAELAAITPTDPVWPDSCGAVDVIEDNLFTRAPYIRGAFFYRSVAQKVGAEMLDEALATFYADHAGGAATMQEMLDTIAAVTGYDATACAQSWLRSTTIPAPGPCP
jgi:aminopeptidase N